MSHHGSDDNFMLSAGGSDSFWEPNNYKRTTKRIEDGNKVTEYVLAVEDFYMAHNGVTRYLSFINVYIKLAVMYGFNGTCDGTC